MKINKILRSFLEEATNRLREAHNLMDKAIDSEGDFDPGEGCSLRHERACIQHRVTALCDILLGQKRTALKNRLKSIASMAEEMASELADPVNGVDDVVDVSDLESELEALSTEYTEALNESE